MAKVLCERHGKNIATSVCGHIAKSIETGKPFKKVRVVELFCEEPWNHYLCQECTDLHSLKEGQTFDELPKPIDSVMTMVCSCCLADAVE